MDIKKLIKETIEQSLGVSDFVVEHPGDEKMGDWSTNVAMVMAKEKSENPRELAGVIVEKLIKEPKLSKRVNKIEVAGPGFINFFMNDLVGLMSLKEVLNKENPYGRNLNRKGEKVIIEFTDPNPFKVFHIGHLMSNSIGESLCRLIDYSGAEVRRACYQGDVGIHVAKSIWGVREILLERNINIEDWEALPLDKKAYELGMAYARGAKEYEENEKAKKQIDELNKVIYQRTDESVNHVYDMGRKWSLDYFETIYKKLGTKFNEYYFESQTGQRGTEVVRENMANGVFEESQGAIVFKGENYGLHTRVFVNSMGLPTYEAKELGLAKTKFDMYPYDLSIIVTANEINEYFKVLIKALSLIYPELAKKTQHVGHGMLKLKYGKMSSRTGNVVSGEGLIDDVSKEVRQKMKETGKLAEIENVDEVITKVAVGAIKYSMLKQSPGKDIMFDFETSLSFEGDSGPYLQYAYARAVNVWKKGGKVEISDDVDGKMVMEEPERQLVKWMTRFPEIVEVASKNLSPNLICSYLIELASRFNHFYSKCQIVGSDKEDFRLSLTYGTATIIKNGLWLLGIETVDKM